MDRANTEHKLFVRNNKDRNFNSQSLDNFNPSSIENRLPKVLFTGPRSLYNHRVKIIDKHEIGIGKSSLLRSMDADYIMRGTTKSMFFKERHNVPGEIGWSVKYFGRFSPSQSQLILPSINQKPR